MEVGSIRGCASMGNEVYKERKLKGLCVRCGKVKEKENSVFCNDCHEKDKEYKKLRRDYLFNRGKCIKCGKEEIHKRKLCLICWGKDNESNRKWKEKHKEERNFRQNLRRKERCNKGVCAICGKLKPELGKKCCEVCLRKIRDYRARRKPKISKRDLWRENNLCFLCGRDEVIEGKKVCLKCYDILVANFNGSKRNNENHIWRKFDKAFLEENKNRKGCI